MNRATASQKESQPNRLCRRCVRLCRQSDQVLLVDCPSFQPRPFKVQDPPKDQLDLFS